MRICAIRGKAMGVHSWQAQHMTPNWPDSNLFWRNQRVVVTGRRGPLRVGSVIVEKRQARGAAEVLVPRIENYDPSALLRTGLVDLSAIRRLLADARPDMILHPSTPLRQALAARVGGIPLRCATGRLRTRREP